MTITDVKKGLFDCYTCRDGERNIDCEECGRKKSTENIVEKEVMQTFDYEKLLIPEFYRGKDFEPRKLHEKHPELKNDQTFLSYVKNLDNLNKAIKAGKVPPMSGIFIAPRTFGKQTFAYSCLQHADMNGLKTFPILDTQALSRFLILSEERPLQPSTGFGPEFKWTYEDFLTADVLFITVTKGFYSRKAFAVIEQAMDMRSRYGKSTFIISSSSMTEIQQFDRVDKSTRMIDSTRTQNPQRYPVIIQYLDHTNKPNMY